MRKVPRIEQNGHRWGIKTGDEFRCIYCRVTFEGPAVAAGVVPKCPVVDKWVRGAADRKLDDAWRSL